jgi:hypothetical protein
MKALGSVITAFESLKKLAMVLGIAGQDVKDGSDTVQKKDNQVKGEKKAIDAEKEDIKKGNEAAKDEIKQSKKEIKKAKRAGKGSTTKLGKFFDKAKYVLEKVTPRMASMGKNIAKALPFVGTILGIGLILNDLYGIGSDIYDVFFGNDEEANDVDEESKPEPSTTTAPGAAPTTSTTSNAPAPAATSSTTSPSPTSSSVVASTSAPSTSVSSGGGTVSTGSTESTGTVVAQSSASVPPTSPPTAQAVIQQSAVVDQMERDEMRTSGSVIISVNNNNILTAANMSKPFTARSIYSVTVGA